MKRPLNTVESAFAIISPCDIQRYLTTFCAVGVKGGGGGIQVLAGLFLRLFLDYALKVHSLSLQF